MYFSLIFFAGSDVNRTSVESVTATRVTVGDHIIMKCS